MIYCVPIQLKQSKAKFRVKEEKSVSFKFLCYFPQIRRDYDNQLLDILQSERNDNIEFEINCLIKINK